MQKQHFKHDWITKSGFVSKWSEFSHSIKLQYLSPILLLVFIAVSCRWWLTGRFDTTYPIKLLQPSHVTFSPSAMSSRLFKSLSSCPLYLAYIDQQVRIFCLLFCLFMSLNNFPERAVEKRGRKKTELHRDSQQASNSKCIFWHLPAHTSLPKANKTTVEKKHCLTCTHSQVSGAAWVDRMRSVGVGGRRETERLTERHTEAKKIYSLSRISPNNLFVVLVSSLMRQGVYICVCSYCKHEQLSFQDRSHR